jgi:hypothetical protein
VSNDSDSRRPRWHLGWKKPDQLETENVRLASLILEAMKDDEKLGRFLKILGFFRSTLLLVIAVIVGSSLILGAGIALTLAQAGIHVTVAISFGAGGSATFNASFYIGCRRSLGRYLGTLREMALHDSPVDPERTRRTPAR